MKLTVQTFLTLDGVMQAPGGPEEDPIATAINSLPKYVVSDSLSEAEATWRGEHPDTARLVTGDVVEAVQAIKAQPGDELQIWGSSQLLRTLLQHELVDRFRLMTYPVVLGSGRRLFNNGALPATMRAVDLTTTDLGIVIGTYEPAGPVRYGEM
jgi:dihydrofolate reductase